MIIGLDYDDTWTRDPDGWFTAMMALKMRGHTIYGITMRYPREASGMDSRYDQVCEQILFTGRRAKRSFAEGRGILVDVWIDDNPVWVDNSAAS